MPRYLADGRIAAGVAGHIVSLGGVTLASPAGGAVPLSDHEIIYARRVALPDVWHVVAHDGVTERPIEPRGASTIYAGGGVWATQTGDGPIRSNGHPELPIAGLKGVGPDGTLAYCRSYHDGRGLILRSRSGTITELVPESGGGCSDVQVLGPAGAVWTQGGRIRATGLDPDLPEGRAGSPRHVVLDGQSWLLCWHADSVGERLLLTPWLGHEGYVLTGEGDADWPAYRPDLRVSGATTLEACWSTTAGEGPTGIRRRTIDVTAARVDLRRAVPILAIGRPLWCGFFEFTPAELPGNCELRQVSIWQWRLWSQGREIAVYVSGDPDGDIKALEESIAAVKPLGLPVLAYWTRKAQGIRVPQGATWIAVEAYRGVDETVPAFERRVRDAVARCPQAVLLGQCYTSNRTLTEDLSSVVPVYARIARDVPHVIGILGFSGSGRATGLQDHPAVLPLWRELFASVTRPALPVETPTLRVPAATVQTFSGLIRPGWRMSIEDTHNPDLAYGVDLEVRENGSLHATLRNRAGSNTTGVLRRVI